MLNFNDLPFIDHHCHPYDPKYILERQLEGYYFGSVDASLSLHLDT